MTEDFVKMPAGTIFAPCDMWGNPLDEYEIKMDTGYEINGEWHFNGTCPVFPHMVDGMFEFFPYDGDSNDARSYDEFMVLDENDIDSIIKVLSWAKGGCSNDNIVEELKGF